MSDAHHDLRCRLGRHHYVGVMDDNPEKRGGSHLECTRCGHIKDVNEYGPPPPGTALGTVGGG
ncbi:hypothetical protein [Nakamurella multipartita]|jgi:hypothetical protein|uniref:Uncharacterized protein n=1 Tax=Nakamurella multipartita (strain ATCC 700099 / DSM 44233 / CIP 104796 / JCM 9543 / NBRC 105858 / Y-104) TaxID=479431 RepID=C8XDB4_NAKMY|nr:hypothetical protein [Nakamurella multipartita]ACV81604.1 hypothetical protein Namu_5340 [Nakamurella multipartita DSM 44233]